MDPRIVDASGLDHGVWKYVGLTDGTFRFCRCESMLEHSAMVKPGERATRAGFILWTDSVWMLQNAVSSSLDIDGNEDDDRAALAQVFGREAMV